MTTLHRRPRPAFTALLLSLAVVLAACSSGSSHSTADTTRPATTATANSTAAPTDTAARHRGLHLGLPIGGHRAYVAAVRPRHSRQPPALPADAERRQLAHRGGTQRRHALRHRAARPAQRAAGPDRPRDPRPVLHVPAHVRLHRVVRLHRHPRHGRRGGIVGHHATRLEGHAARRHAPPLRPHPAGGAARPVPRRRQGRRRQRPRSGHPDLAAAPLGTHRRGRRGSAAPAWGPEGLGAGGREGGPRFLRRARRRAGHQPAGRRL